MTLPLVSVIITCYNYGDHVTDAINSVVNQTYNNIELIVINDGSNDNSDDVITELKKKHGFQYINKSNEGIIATRNLGVSKAKGDFQLQLDADDILDLTYVEKCIAQAKNKNADIVYTQYKTFGRLEFVSKQINHDLEKLKHDNYIHASAMVRSKIMGKNPYDQYLDDKGNEDWDLFLGLCLDGAVAELVDEPLLLYRKHEDKRSRSDFFEGTINEVLVRHHIWSKQNAKHPDEFWYFSSQIDLLLNVIHTYEEFGKRERSFLQKESELKATIVVLKRELKMGFAYRLAKRVKKNIKR